MAYVRRMELLLYLALATPVVAQPASFDCVKAKSIVEKFICSDPELSQADSDLDFLYRRARRDSLDEVNLVRDQRAWLRQRNACRVKECVMGSYYDRLRALAVEPNGNARVTEGPPWIFELTQGGDSAVCRTYLKRLNEGEQAHYPFCDRPETGETFGFAPLQRKALTNEQLHELAQRAHGFAYVGNQDAVELENASRSRFGSAPVDWLTFQNIADYVNKDIFVWQYEPLIDIDNDGKPDRIVIWRGYPVGTHLPGCGWTDKWNRILDDTQMPFFVDEALTRIDTSKTVKIFGHPSVGYKIYEGTAGETHVQKFRPVGTSIGIFKYDGIYYFDTFFDTWGDFKGARRVDAKIASTLGVFAHRNGETKQVCEFLWKNNPNDRRKNYPNDPRTQYEQH